MIAMQEISVTTLHIGVDQTTVTSQSGQTATGPMVLSMGSGRTAADFFNHSPPTPLELENAITAVEDEVIRSQAVAVRHGALRTTDAAIREIALLAGVADGGRMALSVDRVERLFDLLAALSMGRPAGRAGIPTDAGFAATLLILREFMHHLHFTSITIEREGDGGNHKRPS